MTGHGRMEVLHFEDKSALQEQWSPRPAADNDHQLKPVKSQGERTAPNDVWG